VLEPRTPIHARRAARRAQLRRQRLLARAGAIAIAIVAAVAVVAFARSGNSSVHGKRIPAAATHVSATRVHRPRPATNRLASITAAGDANIRRLASLALPIYCAGAHGDEVAFTFDDGPGPYTHDALKKLTQAHERATFFVVGRSMDFFPGWLPRELKVAAIGDHTYTHPVLTRLAAPEIASEIDRTKQKIEGASGQTVYLFRPPYGARSPTVDRIAKRLGLLEILWSVDSADSLGANWAGIIRNVDAGLYPGAIILMHENRGQTIRALTTLLPELHRRHLRSVSLPELFATDPPSSAQVRRGPLGCGRSVKVGRGSG
jgi:peptidoglycan/xylan/chitin deacetylase (PgdA/CDA1 family)